MTAPTHYEVLGVRSTASFDEIRRAFRREIARYHPDKVQHLGHEFQRMAAIRSAELTQAYKILTDETLRADYDADMRSDLARLRNGSVHPSGEPAAARTTPPSRRSAQAAPDPDALSQLGSITTTIRTGLGNLVTRAAVVRFRQAVQAEFGVCEEPPAPGFDVVCAPPKARFWSRLPPRMYARFVGYVDGVAVSDSRAMVSRVVDRDDERGICVFLMGERVAPAAELAVTIARERRKSRSVGLELTIVPVNIRSWSAYVPHDAPPAVRSLVARLRPS